ncbi:hypothetical protein [[Actinomadura] parvosata]|uniref:hypothetical protein n=1 Tax=[Actinomadura] parvosata TaxID=1955412 RepID=UPI00164647E9
MLGPFREPFGPPLEEVVDELPAGLLLVADGGELRRLVPLHERGDGLAQSGEHPGEVLAGREGGVHEGAERDAQFGGPGAGGAVGVQGVPVG